MRRLQDMSSTPTSTANDFQIATETFLRQPQLASFPVALAKLLRMETSSSKDKLFSLNLFIDERQIVRSSGSLHYPQLLAATHLFMMEFHEICHHAGPDCVKSFLQQRYFIFGVRAAPRTISYPYFQCHRFRAENVE